MQCTMCAYACRAHQQVVGGHVWLCITMRLFISCREFVSTFVHFPKPLIVGVNGPAVGISVTLLALCDLVYAADHVSIVL